MSKLDDLATGRGEGLDIALRAVKAAVKDGKDPVRAIEEEMRFRRYSGVKGKRTKAEYNHDSLQIKLTTIMTIKAVALISAWEKFGFGKVRLDRLDEQMEIYTKALVREEIDWMDILDMLKKKLKRDIDWAGAEIKLEDKG